MAESEWCYLREGLQGGLCACSDLTTNSAIMHLKQKLCWQRLGPFTLKDANTPTIVIQTDI